MSDYGYTTIGILPQYRDLINEIADYHGLKIIEFVPLLILAYSLLNTEEREVMLGIGSVILEHHNKGMVLEFNDYLEVSEDCAKVLFNVKE